ncbi:hypothetical protein D3C78_1778690 [compost metagenome]
MGVVFAVVLFVVVGIDALLGIVNSRHIAPLLVIHRKDLAQPQGAGNSTDDISLGLGQQVVHPCMGELLLELVQ